VTWPLALHFTGTVPGDLIADRDQNLWNLWWVKEALLRPTNPYWTDMLYYPYGAPLYYHTLGLPLGIMGLLPQLLFGLPAAYNTVVLAAFVLSGYAAFRLALLYTGKPLAAFLGGVVYAFTPYTLDALKGQLEVLSVQWLPLYAEAWIRATRTGQRKSGVFAGIWLALSAMSSLYYLAYALFFTFAHALYLLWVRWRTGDGRAITQSSVLTTSHLARVAAITAGVAAFLALPLLWGLAAHRSDPRIDVAPDASQKLAYSADLLSFVALPHDHPLVGSPERPGASPPPLHSYLSLGYFALALAVMGVVLARRRRDVWFWAILGLAALVLAMGPELQVGGVRTGVPMPYRLVEWVPGWDAMAKVERLVVLARLCMGVLAAVGAAWVIGRLGASVRVGRARRLERVLPFAAVLALLLVELPIHPRYIEQLGIPQGFQVLAREQPGGGLMELPFATRQAETLGRRMLFQTVHEKPIMGGYLARSYGSPIADTCSPFWGFISARYLDPDAPDIISPQLIARPFDVLQFYGIDRLAVYETYGGPQDEPLAPEERTAFMRIVSQVSGSPPLAQDDYVTIYKVDNSTAIVPEAALLMGNNWYDIETSGGEPFRWVREETARLCVFHPNVNSPLPNHPVLPSVRLTMEGTAFGEERDVQILVEGREIYKGTLPAGGTFASIDTSWLEWKTGMTEITIRSTRPPTTPNSLDSASTDSRPLRVGFRRVRLESLFR
jgi:hypothetical protein